MNKLIKNKRVRKLSGLAAFEKAFKPNRLLLIGDSGIAIEDFLKTPIQHWVSN